MSEPVDPGRLSADIRALLRALSARLRAESGDAGNLPIAQHDALSRIVASPGATSAELARDHGVRPQSMGATISALRDAGLVETRPNPQDGRRRELFPTEAGASVLERVGAVRQDWLARRLVGNLDEAERAELARATELMHRLLD